MLQIELTRSKEERETLQSSINFYLEEIQRLRESTDQQMHQLKQSEKLSNAANEVKLRAEAEFRQKELELEISHL